MAQHLAKLMLFSDTSHATAEGYHCFPGAPSWPKQKKSACGRVLGHDKLKMSRDAFWAWEQNACGRILGHNTLKMSRGAFWAEWKLNCSRILGHDKLKFSRGALVAGNKAPAAGS
jgi:hypothetical protein